MVVGPLHHGCKQPQDGDGQRDQGRQTVFVADVGRRAGYSRAAGFAAEMGIVAACWPTLPAGLGWAMFRHGGLLPGWDGDRPVPGMSRILEGEHMRTPVRVHSTAIVCWAARRAAEQRVWPGKYTRCQLGNGPASSYS